MHITLDTLYGQGHTQMFAVTPLPWCAHLDSVTPVPSGRIDTGASCEECGDVTENWICLVCYKVRLLQWSLNSYQYLPIVLFTQILTKWDPRVINDK